MDELFTFSRPENIMDFDVFPFLSIDNINCLCLAMLQVKNFRKLEEFLNLIPNLSEIKTFEVYRARIHVGCRKGDLNEVFKLIQAINYPKQYWNELQAIWFTARCKESLHRKRIKYERAEAKILSRMLNANTSDSLISLEKYRNLVFKDKLGSVDRNRIKKKYPYPLTIWDGDKVRYKKKESSRRILQDYFTRITNPGSLIKEQISIETGLTINQITNWFKNRRQRVNESKAKN